MVAVTSPLITTFAEAEMQRYRPHHRTTASPTKFFERRIVQAWKKVTRSFHKHDRSLPLPEGFVLMSARRRSILYANANNRL